MGRLTFSLILCWLAATPSLGATTWDASRVLSLFADLPQHVEIVDTVALEPPLTAERQTLGRRYRLRSALPIDQTAAGPVYLRASLSIQRWHDPAAAASEVRRQQAAADPDTGLSYAWDLVLARDGALYHLAADCTFGGESFARVASRLVEATGGRETVGALSFWCRCGGGCRSGAPGAPAASLTLPRVRHPDGEVEDYDNQLDPSGLWRSTIGELALMHYADTLSFAYLATFGPTAHLCEGAGVAGLTGTDRYEYVDDQGTLGLIIEEKGVRFEVIDGIASFCGAGWSGDFFEIARHQLPLECEVTAERATFHVVDHLDPEPRSTFALEGAQVAGVPAPLGDPGWILGRLVERSTTIVGLLHRSELRCPPAGG